MSVKADRALNETETRLVEQSKQAETLTGRELTDLVRQLRERREAIKRSMRERARAGRHEGRPVADTGAEAKKTELVAAIERVSAVLEARKPENWQNEPVRGPSKPATKPAPKAKPKTAFKPRSAEAAAKAATETKAKPKAASKPKAEAKPAAEDKPKAAKKAEPKSEAKSEAKSETKPKAKPKADSDA